MAWSVNISRDVWSFTVESVWRNGTRVALEWRQSVWRFGVTDSNIARANWFSHRQGNQMALLSWFVWHGNFNNPIETHTFCMLTLYELGEMTVTKLGTALQIRNVMRSDDKTSSRRLWHVCPGSKRLYNLNLHRIQKPRNRRMSARNALHSVSPNFLTFSYGHSTCYQVMDQWI